MAVSTGNYAIKVLKSGSKVGDGYLVGGETHALKKIGTAGLMAAASHLLRCFLVIKLRGG